MSGPGKLFLGKEEKSLLISIIESGHLFRYGDDKDKNFKKTVYTLEKKFSWAAWQPFRIFFDEPLDEIPIKTSPSSP